MPISEKNLISFFTQIKIFNIPKKIRTKIFQSNWCKYKNNAVYKIK